MKPDVNANKQNNPQIDRASWAAVETAMGTKISEEKMAEYVAGGMVSMQISNDGVARFSIVPGKWRPISTVGGRLR